MLTFIIELGAHDVTLGQFNFGKNERGDPNDEPYLPIIPTRYMLVPCNPFSALSARSCKALEWQIWGTSVRAAA